MAKDIYILGISCFYHDAAAVLVKNGRVIAAAQEERFTRKKHDSSFPQNVIRYCLEEAHIKREALNYIAFYDKPFLKFERILETYLNFAPRGIESFLKAIPTYLKQKIWIKELIQKEFDNYQGEILFPEHHESHAASAFYLSPFKEAAFLTLDGVGEWTTTSFGVGRGNKLSIIADIKFPHSPGLLYSAFTYYTGFRVNSDEYKVMGLAPYGEPKYRDLILKKLIDLKEDGSFKMDMDYFNYCTGLTMTNQKFSRLFEGPPRKPESKITQREMDMAHSVQEITEEIVMRIADHIYKETKQKYLCLAGGVALNCVANGKLLCQGPFEDIWIQPAAGDAGGALGAALVVWYQYLNNPREADDIHDFQQGSYLGPSFSDKQILEYLEKHKIPHKGISPEKIPGQIADLIACEKVVGCFQGRMEFGPRALGSRSILGDARSSQMQKTMNLKIKFRESFRPFAPSVLAEKRDEYFDIDRPSPYMLLVAQVKKKHQRELTAEEKKISGIEKVTIVRSDIPAVTHVDYSARLQTVHRETNSLYWKMIKAFDEKYGCPVIINTSFNVRGEPIVCDPKDAYLCFMRTEIDYLIMGNYLLDKREQPPLENDVEIGVKNLNWIKTTFFEYTKNIKKSKKEFKKFGLIVGAVFILLAGFFLWREKEYYFYFLVIGVLLSFLGLVAPSILAPFQKVWMGFASIMSWLMNRLILGAIFYMVVTPIALAARISGKKFLDLKIDKNQISYWHYRQKQPERSQYKKQF